MRYLITFLLVILVVVLLLDVTDARGGRGGGNSRSGRRSWAGSRGRSRRTLRRTSSLKPRITKNTPIKPTTFRTPVIYGQTKILSRSKLFTKVETGSYIVTRYQLATAPVYRVGFPVHGIYVSVPAQRAVRLSSETERLLDSTGSLCLGRSYQFHTLKQGIERSLIELNAIVKYYDGKKETVFGVNKTISLKDIKENSFSVITRAQYNVSVVENTKCTQVEEQVNGTMIQLFQFNPNAPNAAQETESNLTTTNPSVANTACKDFNFTFLSFMVLGILR